MAKIEIYTTRICPYCVAAKRLLDSKQAGFEEIDVTADPEERARMTARAGGLRTVPQIFINGDHIGGCTDLLALERAGHLDALLAAG